MIDFKEIARIVLLLILAILYFIIPYDLIPDSLGRIGRLDDVLFLLAIIGWYFFKPLYDEISAKVRQKSNANYHQQQNSTPASIENAYEILGVTSAASLSEVKKAYYQLIKQYHPDRVDDLGPELKVLAGSKTAQLNAAYEMLRKRLDE